MDKKRFAASVLCCLLLVLFLVSFVEKAGADETASGDKELSTRRGLDVLEDQPGEEKSDGATTLQMGLGVASIFVMIAVVKWL